MPSHPHCVVEKGAPKCSKCTQAVQGCYWEGVSRRGVHKADVLKRGGRKVEEATRVLPARTTAAKETLRPKPGTRIVRYFFEGSDELCSDSNSTGEGHRAYWKRRGAFEAVRKKGEGIEGEGKGESEGGSRGRGLRGDGRGSGDASSTHRGEIGSEASRSGDAFGRDRGIGGINGGVGLYCFCFCVDFL